MDSMDSKQGSCTPWAHPISDVKLLSACNPCGAVQLVSRKQWDIAEKIWGGEIQSLSWPPLEISTSGGYTFFGLPFCENKILPGIWFKIFLWQLFGLPQQCKQGRACLICEPCKVYKGQVCNPRGTTKWIQTPVAEHIYIYMVHILGLLTRFSLDIVY